MTPSAAKGAIALAAAEALLLLGLIGGAAMRADLLDVPAGPLMPGTDRPSPTTTTDPRAPGGPWDPARLPRSTVLTLPDGAEGTVPADTPASTTLGAVPMPTVLGRTAQVGSSTTAAPAPGPSAPPVTTDRAPVGTVAPPVGTTAPPTTAPPPTTTTTAVEPPTTTEAPPTTVPEPTTSAVPPTTEAPPTTTSELEIVDLSPVESTIVSPTLPDQVA